MSMTADVTQVAHPGEDLHQLQELSADVALAAHPDEGRKDEYTPSLI